MVFLKGLYQIFSERLRNKLNFCILGFVLRETLVEIILHLVENTSAILNNHKSTKNFKIYIKKIIFSQGGKNGPL